MNLLDLINRTPAPNAWEEGDNIPWHEPEFSARMLKEHLSQAHDAASRRFSIIDQQVTWIHQTILQGRPARILDLGCGPGLYTNRLGALGHTCVGIDYSPASIAYARAQADASLVGDAPACIFIHQDIRTADYGAGFDLVMLIFGEFNVFRPSHIRRILRKARAALKEGGLLLLEPHTFDAVKRLGTAPSSWTSEPAGLFSPEPHLLLTENFWNAEEQTATLRYFVIDAAAAQVAPYAQSMQAYTNDQYREVLSACGFRDIVIHPALGVKEGDPWDNLQAIVAKV
ncbi:MAG: class I SAM-dependent methyltransferase [Anaerolineae bacterium]|nr:class I SAM-dependent methyltransferase [Anaerolineae bacterium]